MVSIEIDDVSFSYESLDALKNVTLEVKQGEFIGIIGPNGAGKSTLLSIISRILMPRSGAVLLEDLDIQQMSQKALARKVGFVAQDSNIPFRFTALDLVLMGRNPYLGRFEIESHQDLKIAQESMKRTAISHLAHRAATEISGGERQRVLIARALTQTPRVMLLDEPTLHLDVSSQIDIMDLLQDLCTKNNLTVVSVFHDFNLAARYCDRIVLMNKGRIEATGTPEEVLTRENIKNVFGIDAHVGRNFLTDSVYAIPLTNKKPKDLNKDWIVHLICGGGSGASIMRRLVNEGWGVTAGVLNLLDTDHEVAYSLGISIVPEAPFSPITESAHKQNLEFISKSDTVLVTDFLVGRDNIMNLEAAKASVQSGFPTILIKSRSIVDRDFTGGAGAALVRVMVNLGAKRVEDLEEALILLEGLRKNRLKSSEYLERSA